MAGHSGLSELRRLHPRRRLGRSRGRFEGTLPADGSRRNRSRRARTPHLPRLCVSTEGEGDEEEEERDRRRQAPGARGSRGGTGAHAHPRRRRSPHALHNRAGPSPTQNHAGQTPDHHASPQRLSFPLRGLRMGSGDVRGGRPPETARRLGSLLDSCRGDSASLPASEPLLSPPTPIM